MKYTRLIAAVAVLAVLLPVYAGAGTYDGSQPIICAPVTAVSCTADGKCESSGPAGVNLPPFLRVNAAEKIISGTRPDGETREVAISHSAKGEGVIFLQGSQEGRAWSLEIDRTNGMMTLAVAGREEGFLAFGACTNP